MYRAAGRNRRQSRDSCQAATTPSEDPPLLLARTSLQTCAECDDLRRDTSHVGADPSPTTWPRWQIALIVAALAVFLSYAVYDVVTNRYVPAAWSCIVAGGMLITIDATRKNDERTLQLQIGLTAILSWVLAFPTGFVLSRDSHVHHSARTVIFFAIPVALSLAATHVLCRFLLKHRRIAASGVNRDGQS